MYMATTIFFPSAAGALSSSFIQHVDDFDTIKGICWPSVIQHDLMSRIRSHHSKPTKVIRCVLQLLRVLRKFHKYSMQGPVFALLYGNLSQEQIPYEKSFWGAMEDPFDIL
ncbi:hypothetical protein IFM89_026369 [Coptis chinensis]|uniref:Uncharacterized protein n=1 Tax=Coptis chinensis TaxID=261450 RepID=A0A835HMD1_9MAGN|nr:hypothetical protein IFM89_026369 [Coptis chinensis]